MPFVLGGYPAKSARAEIGSLDEACSFSIEEAESASLGWAELTSAGKRFGGRRAGGYSISLRL
jgi:hypothetical protein